MSDTSRMTPAEWQREMKIKDDLATRQSDIIVSLRFALLNIDGTARKWAVASGGDTPLALIASMARDSLGFATSEEADAEIARVAKKK